MGTPLLRYDLMTQPFPLQASPATQTPRVEGGSEPGLEAGAPSESLSASAPSVAVLAVVASNPNPDAVKNPIPIRGVSITIPVGANATDLTNDAKLGPVAPTGWKLNEVKAGEGVLVFDFQPQGGQGAVGKDGLVFTFNTVTINSQPGTAQILIKEGTTGNPTKQLFVTKFPNGWGTVSFWLDPVNVTYGSSTTLNWDGPSGATYTIQYALDGQVYNLPAQGSPPLGSSGKYPGDTDPPLKLSQTTVFTLGVTETISGHSYRAQEQKIATVQVPAPSINIEAIPSIISADKPQPVRLQWTTANVSELAIGNVGNFSGAQAASGKANVTPSVTPPSASANYFATAYGLPGYTGPPALGEASVLFTWAAASSWCGVWDDHPTSGVFWSLKLWDGRDALDLKLVVEDDQGGQHRSVGADLPAGVQGADLGTQGVNTPASAWTQAQWGGWLPNATLYQNVGEYSHEEIDNVGHTWGLKFPDGHLVLIWFIGGDSQGWGVFSNKWRFNFGWTYHANPQLRLHPR